jgi:hypothetical protein
MHTCTIQMFRRAQRGQNQPPGPSPKLWLELPVMLPRSAEGGAVTLPPAEGGACWSRGIPSRRRSVGTPDEPSRCASYSDPTGSRRGRTSRGCRRRISNSRSTPKRRDGHQRQLHELSLKPTSCRMPPNQRTNRRNATGGISLVLRSYGGRSTLLRRAPHGIHRGGRFARARTATGLARRSETLWAASSAEHPPGFV